MKVRTMARSLMMSCLGIASMTAVAVAIPGQQAQSPAILVAESIPELRWPTAGILSQGFHRHHDGIDIAGPIGTAIVAAQAGEVIQAGWDDWGLGKAITIQHPDGSRTVYGHNKTLYVRGGEWVEQGQLIAEMGNTGNSSGPHLHFEYYSPNNIAVNPLPHLPTLIAGEIPDPSQPTTGPTTASANCAGESLLAAETRNYRVEICQVRNQLFYVGQSKQNPDDTIRLPARFSGWGYQAINGNYTYQVERDRLDVFRGNEKVRSEPFL